MVLWWSADPQGHWELSEAIQQGPHPVLGCFVATLGAMTRHGRAEQRPVDGAGRRCHHARRLAEDMCPTPCSRPR